MKFTQSQLDAIGHGDTNLQLIACAGSGKTEVVAQRVATLLKAGLKPGNIVAFTFTDKAAGEAEGLTERHLHTPYAYEKLREKLEQAAARVISDYIKDNQADLKNIEFSEKKIDIALDDGRTVRSPYDPFPMAGIRTNPQTRFGHEDRISSLGHTKPGGLSRPPPPLFLLLGAHSSFAQNTVPLPAEYGSERSIPFSCSDPSKSSQSQGRCKPLRPLRL
jgi:hypothetical protein